MTSDLFLLSSTSFNFQFGDKRIDRRANYMLDTMAKHSQKSLPEIFCSNADLKGTYRFFSNNLVTPEKILQPHIEATIKRCEQQNVVLVIQDSSDCNYDFMECLEGFESMHTHVNKGFRIHPQLVTTERGTPLGLLNSFNYTRITNDLPKKHRNSLPIEEKESYRWLLGYRKACDLAKQVPKTTVISISDREGDLYECFAESQDPTIIHKAEILVRAKHNRSLSGATDKTTDKLEKKLIRCPVSYETEITLAQYGKKKRKANLVIRASEITFKAPNTCKKKSLVPVKMNAVLITELEPPQGEEPLNWLLLTTLPIDSIEDIKRIIILYSKRWSIEIFFKVLKSGCKIDSCRFQETDRIENFIAFAMIVAWKVMLITYLPREYPNAPCSLIFTELEWKLVYSRVYENKRPLPQQEPTLKEISILVAMLGGYQKRKDPPGIQTIWRGFVRVIDMVYGYELTKEIMSNV